MFENFINKLLLLLILCFIFANCNEQKARNRYYPRNFAYSYWNDGGNLLGYIDKYHRLALDYQGWGPQTTDTQKFCWRWVKASDGKNYKVVTIEEGDSDLSTDSNARTNDSFVYPYQLRNDFGSSGFSTDYAFFKPILVHIHGNTFEISKPSYSGHNFILVGIHEILSNDYFRRIGDVDIIPSDLVGTNNYLDQITGSTKFRSRYVELNSIDFGIRLQVLTLEE